jgi:glycosyltransferase involved in cell wall biosynthesis
MDLEAFPFQRREPLEPVVLIARHLKPEYNVAAAIRAFAEIAGQHPNATAVIAGDGADREALERLCEELGVAARVRFVGNVDSRQMQALYAQSHIYLNASRVDNQPVSILEAFAAGLPVVSTAAGGIPFLVENGRSGLLTSDDSHQSLAAHLRTLLARPDIVRHLVDNARASVQFHRWDAVYPRLAELYRSPDPR